MPATKHVCMKCTRTLRRQVRFRTRAKSLPFTFVAISVIVQRILMVKRQDSKLRSNVLKITKVQNNFGKAQVVAQCCELSCLPGEAFSYPASRKSRLPKEISLNQSAFLDLTDNNTIRPVEKFSSLLQHQPTSCCSVHDKAKPHNFFG